MFLFDLAGLPARKCGAEALETLRSELRHCRFACCGIPGNMKRRLPWSIRSLDEKVPSPPPDELAGVEPLSNPRLAGIPFACLPVADPRHVGRGQHRSRADFSGIG